MRSFPRGSRAGRLLTCVGMGMWLGGGGREGQRDGVESEVMLHVGLRWRLELGVGR
jgi:hypothetical protein